MSDQFLTFDDVLIVPNYSNIESRQDINTAVSFLGTTLQIPVISANMDFVTGPVMAKAMQDNGGLGILHRFWPSKEEYLAAIVTAKESGVDPLYISLGVRDIKGNVAFIKEVMGLVKIEGICIDVAHGYHQKVADMVEAIKGHPNDNIAALKVIAGNIANIEGVEFLREAGVDAIKVGIGAGSVCTTRSVAGVGVPQWSAIMECSTVKDEHPELMIIADGGVRTSGDIAKALAAGADVVMLGNMLAGTDEAPGEIVGGEPAACCEYACYEDEGCSCSGCISAKFKRYRGQASFGSNGERYVKEGIEGMVPYKGPLAPIIQQIRAGIVSAMSYTGSIDLKEFKEDARFVQVSSHTLMENNTRVREM